MSKLFVGMTFVSLLLFSGCSMKVDYNKDYIASEMNNNLAKNSQINVAVYTTKEMDDSKFIGRPNSFAGSANTLEVPTGIITREVTYEFFSQYFAKVEKVSEQQVLDKNGYQIILTPSTNNFYYEFEQLSNLGFAITPKTRFSLHLTVNKDNKKIFDKSYDSGLINGETYVLSGSPYETVSKTYHKGLFNLYKMVNQDIIMAISNN